MADLNRIAQIRKYLIQNRQVQVTEISRLFGVSVATARRDLDRLAEYGEIERTHGGARMLYTTLPEPPVLQRRSEQQNEKQRIGQAAADLVQDGETILLGDGTTVWEVAKHLSGKQNLTVITNFLLAAETLASYSSAHLIVLGGIIRQSELVCYGHFTEMALAELYADKVIIGARALSLDRGLTMDYIPEMSTIRLMLARAKQVVIVADYTKFGLQSTSLVCPLDQIDTIITDDQSPPKMLQAVREMGIEVIVV